MKKHVCRQCNRVYEYCRGCLLSPISHYEMGFCSKECYEASKKVVEPIVEIKPIVEEIAAVAIEETNESLIEDVQPTSIETEVDTEVSVVAEPTIKKETYNAYRKKKKKHKQYTSSL